MKAWRGGGYGRWLRSVLERRRGVPYALALCAALLLLVPATQAWMQAPAGAAGPAAQILAIGHSTDAVPAPHLQRASARQQHWLSVDLLDEAHHGWSASGPTAGERRQDHAVPRFERSDKPHERAPPA